MRAAPAVVLLLSVAFLGVPALADDDFELDPDAIEERVFELDGGVTATLRWVARPYPDPVCGYDLDLAWTDPSGTSRTQRLLDHNAGGGGGCGLTVTADADGLVLHWPDTSRYAEEGAVQHERFRLDHDAGEYYSAEAWRTSRWADHLVRLQGLLDRGEFAAARALVAEIGTSPNGGHTPADADVLARFAAATHREALRAHQEGRKEAAAALVRTFLAETPIHDGGQLDEPCYLLTLGPSDRPHVARLAPTDEHHRIVNDLGFILAEAGDLAAAIPLLEQVVALAPDRAVAWLNLADARDAAGDREGAAAARKEHERRR